MAPEVFERGIVLLSPAMGDTALTKDAFSLNAEAFLHNKMPAELFLDVCSTALDVFEGDEFCETVYKFKYLCFIALNRHYEAQATAGVIMREFGNAMLYYQMMCSLFLRRKNYRQALVCVDRMMDITLKAMPEQESRSAAFEYAKERGDLAGFINLIRCFSAEDFARIVGRDVEAGNKQFSGVPLQIRGMPELLKHPASGNPFLVFALQGESLRSIYCRMPHSEVPFLRNLSPGDVIEVFGYLLKADETKILIKPGYILDAAADMPLV